MSVTALTLQVLCLDDLTTGLVFKLTILAEKLETEAADEDPSSVVPDTTLTLDTLSLSQGTAAGVGLETFLTGPGDISYRGKPRPRKSRKWLQPSAFQLYSFLDV